MIIKYPLRLDDQKSFAGFLLRLGHITRNRRQSFDVPDNTPLNPRETRALAAISKQMQRQMSTLPPDARSKAEATVEEAIALLGAYGYLNLFLVEPKVMGVSLSWFAANVIICIGLYTVTTPLTLFFVAPVLHIIGCLVCPSRLKKQREESLQVWLGEVFPTH